MAEAERTRYEEADPDDLKTRVLIAGEALDLIDDIKPGAEIVHGIVDQAAGLLRRTETFLT